MSKKAMKGIFIGLMILALVVVPVLAFFSEAGSETAYDVPRMLGMESEKGEVARLDGPPTTDVSAPIFETTARLNHSIKTCVIFPLPFMRPAKNGFSPPRGSNPVTPFHMQTHSPCSWRRNS